MNPTALSVSGKTADLRGLDTEGQINEILRSIGPTDIRIDSFTAIYVVSALQVALSQPSMMNDDSPTARVEAFAHELTESIAKKHPQLLGMVQNGWRSVELCRVAFKNTKARMAITSDLPSTVRGLRVVAKELGIEKATKLKKDELIDKIVTVKLQKA